MRTETNIPNKIIPVKSLVESTKHSNKKPIVQFPNNEYNNLPHEHFHAHKHMQPYSHMSNHSFSPFECNVPQELQAHKQKIKGISLGSKNYSLMKVSQQGGQKNETPQKYYKQFQEYTHSSKKQVQGHSRHESDITKNFNFLSDGTIKQVAVDKTPRKIENIPFDEKLSYRGLINEKKEFFKSVTLNRTDEQDSHFLGQKISTKIEDQTWNVSKFEKFMSNEREGQPIYKDELTKIKTELFQKEALLFEATQKIEEKERNINELKYKLEIQMELNSNLKSKLSSQVSYKQNDRNTSETISQNQKLNSEIIRLKNELTKNKQQKLKEETDSFASAKLVQLKLKQFQLEEKERTQYIIELKQKQKKMVEGYEKMLNAQRELLRQKEQQLTQISHAAHFYKEQYSKLSKDSEKISEDSKEMVIRELSGEIGDLKESLKNMEIRMRELIENQQQLRKELENKNESKNYQIKIENELRQLKAQCLSKENELRKLIQEKNTCLNKISQLEHKLDSKVSELENNANLKEMEVFMMTKTCEQYKRKLDQYHKYSQQMRLSLLNYNQIEIELKKVLIEKQQEIQVLKNVIEPYDKNKSPQKQMSPIKEGRAEDKEYTRLKSINYKLIKENEKLNIIVKDLDFKIYQLYKVNEGLNETILVELFKAMNENLKQKYGEIQNQIAQQ